ncbi:hypothetical protein IEQ34_008556 [Dendrobium chrysotoxum]|uniref:HMA domain-containing protein n=1 Tax=Dendrobium chrysotoxum TaxID=161865 RepID=A0AAV7GW90_DENCH|nr:hypothetical protein IEQ34_008556 [Dendrobium chrysotoxum]
MSKEDDIKFLKIQTCVLKVNIHCDGCKQKVKKLLQKVDGVFQTNIDAEQGRVTVSGNVDPVTLVKKLNKAGKHAEILLPKGVNITQLQKHQQDNQKAQQNKDNGKPPKSSAGAGAGNGGGGGKDQKGQATHVQQTKGLKDLKFPQLKDLKFPFHKDPKSVKFALPPEVGEDCSDYDDDDDFDDDDFDDEDMDEFDSFDADFDEDFRNLKLKPGSAQPNHPNVAMVIPDKKNGKKGGPVEIPVQVKGMNGNNDAKSGKKGGINQNQAGSGGGKNAGKVPGGGGVAQDVKNVGNNGTPKPNANSGKKGGGGGGGSGGGGGGLKNEAAGGAPNTAKGGPMGLPAGFPVGMNAGQMGFIPPMGQAAGAVQGLPPGMAPQGYFPAGGMPAMSPEMMAAAAASGGAVNPYQQQYMAAMMQQQQRMMMNGQDRGYPPMMGYPRPPPPPAMYMAQPPPYGEPYTNYFSDENANSCSIM